MSLGYLIYNNNKRILRNKLKITNMLKNYKIIYKNKLFQKKNIRLNKVFQSRWKNLLKILKITMRMILLIAKDFYNGSNNNFKIYIKIKINSILINNKTSKKLCRTKIYKIMIIIKSQEKR